MSLRSGRRTQSGYADAEEIGAFSDNVPAALSHSAGPWIAWAIIVSLLVIFCVVGAGLGTSAWYNGADTVAGTDGVLAVKTGNNVVLSNNQTTHALEYPYTSPQANYFQFASNVVSVSYNTNYLTSFYIAARGGGTSQGYNLTDGSYRFPNPGTYSLSVSTDLTSGAGNPLIYFWFNAMMACPEPTCTVGTPIPFNGCSGWNVWTTTLVGYLEADQHCEILVGPQQEIQVGWYLVSNLYVQGSGASVNPGQMTAFYTLQQIL